jgi:long-chain fatty acid transport protein
MKCYLRLMICSGMLLLLNSFVLGSAYGLFEQGTRASGMAGAFTATANDPSAIFYNPAGLAFFSQKQLYVGGNIFNISGSFTGSAPVPGDGVKERLRNTTLLLPNVYYVHPINDKIIAGVGVYTPFGLTTDWESPEKFTGRFIATRTQLSSFSITPSIGYQLNKNMGFGFGLELRESKVILERNLPVLFSDLNAVFDSAHLTIDSGYKMNVSFNAGFLYKFLDTYRIGLTYRHSVNAKYSGKADLNLIPLTNPPGGSIPGIVLPEGSVSVTANLYYPSMLSVGFAYQPRENMNLELDISWTKWDGLKEITIVFPENPVYNTTIPSKYKNALNFRLGAELKLRPDMTARAGYYFDQSPVPVESIDPIIPDSNRHGLSLGLSLVHGQMTLEVYNLFVLFQKAQTKGQSHFNYNGNYSKFADIIGIAMNYNW